MKDRSQENNQKFKLKRTFGSLFQGKDKSKYAPSDLPPATTKAEDDVPNMSAVADRTIDIPEIEEERQKRERNVKSLQNVNFWDRTKWAAGDHQALKNMIKSIKEGNDELRKFLKLRSLNDTALLLPRSKELESLSNVGKNISTALVDLHEALKSLNYRRKGQDPYSFSIQVREDNDASRKDLAQAEGVILQNGSVVFNLQRHDASNTMGNPTTLAIESLPTHKTSNTTELHNLRNPNGAINDTEDDTEIDTDVETWGYIRTPGLADKYHVLYHDKASLWPASITLVDLLSGPDYVEYINPIQVLQAARMIAVAYLYHSEVRLSCGDPRPHNFRYYLTTDERPKWTDEDPLILNPWLSYGFGQRSARPPIGGGSGVARPLNASVVELGLVLYQVACGQVLQYGTGVNGFKKARSEAIKRLYVVTRVFGASLTSIIQSCLEYQGMESFLAAKKSAASDFDFMEKIVSALYECEKMFEDNTSPAFAFRRFVDTTEDQLDGENFASVLATTLNSTTLTMSTSSLTGGRRGSSIAETETLGEGKSTALQSKVAQSSNGKDAVVVEDEKEDVEQAEIRKELLDLASPPSQICKVFKYSANEPRKDQRIPLEA